jgi:hypothetical protein
MKEALGVVLFMFLASLCNADSLISKSRNDLKGNAIEQADGSTKRSISTTSEFRPQDDVANKDGLSALTDIQIEKFAEMIKRRTPDNTHFEKGTKFGWVCLSFDGSVSEKIRNEIRSILSKNYIVYSSHEQIPSAKVHKKGKEILGYNGGFLFEIKNLKLIDADTIEVACSDYEGNLASSWCRIKYHWDGAKWVDLGGDCLIS